MWKWFDCSYRFTYVSGAYCRFLDETIGRYYRRDYEDEDDGNHFRGSHDGRRCSNSRSRVAGIVGMQVSEE